jgi:hypothetical protein
VLDKGTHSTRNDQEDNPLDTDVSFRDVHPDRQSPIARPVDVHQDWLDVRAGDDVYLKGRRNRVVEVRLYRGSDGACTVSHETVITCGRDWLCE